MNLPKLAPEDATSQIPSQAHCIAYDHMIYNIHGPLIY